MKVANGGIGVATRGEQPQNVEGMDGPLVLDPDGKSTKFIPARARHPLHKPAWMTCSSTTLQQPKLRPVAGYGVYL